MLSRPVSARAAELIGRHLKVIGSPVRVRMIEALERCGELSVTELAEAVEVSGEDASQHLAVLRREGVVGRRKEGRRQLYHLTDALAVVAIYELAIENVRQRAAPDAERSEPG